jgi:hypothetical protein
MPTVKREILFAFAGIVWTGVGLLLIRIAGRWFAEFSTLEFRMVIIGGLLLGSAISYFGFTNLAQKNIDRIAKYEDRVSLWKFQKKQTYFLIVFMISLGIFMRTSGLVPPILLSPMYIGIGFALFSASFKYYFYLFRRKMNNQES